MKAVILAGGGGTRLWPLSTPEKPKQFQKLVSDKTMLEETIDRLDFLPFSDIYVATNQEYVELVKQLCPQIPAENIIAEPALRDTASCIGYSAAIIENKYPNSVMAVIYADHLIQNKAEFQEKLQIAAKIALEEDTLNIIEVTAKEPNTNYGYVKLGKLDRQIDHTEVYHLAHFTEKPDTETAQKFVASNEYLWNTGIYVWKTSVLLEQYQKHQPATYEKLQTMIQKPDQIGTIYPTLEKISIDYAIMEKVDPLKVRIIKADLGWSDIGNWEAIWEKLADKELNNLTRGETKLLDCKGCLVYSDHNKTIVGIGLEDLIIIDTKDGLLISKKDQSKRLKEV